MILYQLARSFHETYSPWYFCGWPSPTFARLGLYCRGAEPKLGVNVGFLLILGSEDAK